MDKKLLLVTAITLLYRESQLEPRIENSSKFVRELLPTISVPEISIVGTLDSERDILVGLKNICLEMCENPVTHQYENIELLQKIRHIVREDESLYNSFEKGITDPVEGQALKRLCLNLRFSLQRFLNRDKIVDVVNQAARKLKFEPETIDDIQTFILELNANLSTHLKKDGGDDNALKSSLDFDNIEQLESVLDVAKELNNENGLMKTGWQGLNRMLQGGIRRGETILLSALQHNFKTGLSLALFKQIAQYNKPYMLDPTKKPTLVRISFEDPLTSNLMSLYKNIFENKTNKQADFNNVSSKEMAAFINSELNINGYKIVMTHDNPSNWTYLDIIKYCNDLESQGLEIHVLMIDYLNMIPKTGCDNTGPMGSNIRDLLRKVRNYCLSRKITLITPHQLSTEAKMLIRNGLQETFVQEIAGKGYYDGCRTLDQEADCEIHFHIVKEDGKSWLTVQRGKHRLPNIISEELKYIVLPFETVGDIRDDINGEDSTRRKPGGPPIGSRESRAHFDFDVEK